MRRSTGLPDQAPYSFRGADQLWRGPTELGSRARARTEGDTEPGEVAEARPTRRTGRFEGPLFVRQIKKT